MYTDEIVIILCLLSFLLGYIIKSIPGFTIEIKEIEQRRIK